MVASVAGTLEDALQLGESVATVMKRLADRHDCAFFEQGEAAAEPGGLPGELRTVKILVECLTKSSSYC